MPPYEVRCTRGGCASRAAYKVAARWSDGLTQELKTYALACAGCLRAALEEARAKQSACRRAAGESLEAPGVYELARGKRDAQLVRREDLERGPNEPGAAGG
jgi:hypothetical protein